MVLMDSENNLSIVEIPTENQMARRQNHCEMSCTSGQRYNEFMANSCCSQLCDGPNPQMARYVYGLIFLLTNLLAWMVRDYGHNALSELKQHTNRGAEKGNKTCLKELQKTYYNRSERLSRRSLLLRDRRCTSREPRLLHEKYLKCTLTAAQIFYFIMFLTTVGSAKLYEPRDSWHSGWWPLKSLMWIALMVVPFVVPSAFIQLYGEIARFGAGIFLIIQLISVINFITWWNDHWLSEKNAGRWKIDGKVAEVLVNAGLLKSGLMGLYVVFLCWSAIRSEPATEICNTRPQATGRGDWITIVSFVIAVLAIVMATFSTGIDSKSFQFRKDEVQAEDDVPYGYGFFHFVFSMGAMYFAMLFIGWNLHQTMQKWSIDVGWASTWVKIVNEWLAAGVYKDQVFLAPLLSHKYLLQLSDPKLKALWTLIAPLIWKNGGSGASMSDV
eukprot:Gb_36065 [translate_table: standard]